MIALWYCKCYIKGLDSLGSTNISFLLLLVLLLGVGVILTIPFCLLGCRGVTMLSSFSSSSYCSRFNKVRLSVGFFGVSLWFGGVSLQATFLRCCLCGEAKNATLSFRLGTRSSATLCRLLGVVASGNWRSGEVEQWRRPCQLDLGTIRTLILIVLLSFPLLPLSRR